MQVMVMNDDPAVQIRVTKGLMSKGFQVVGMETIARACAYVKLDPVDILITGERIGGRLSHTVALAAECANPMVTTMLLTNRNDPEIEELYELLPSLYALVSPESDPAVVARLALSAVASPEDAEARMRRNAEARMAQPMADWAAVFQETAAVAMAHADADDLAEDDMLAYDEADEVAEDAADEIAFWGEVEATYADEEPEPEPAMARLSPDRDERSFERAFSDLLREEAAAAPTMALTIAETPRPANPLFAPAGSVTRTPVAAPSEPPSAAPMGGLPEVRSRTTRMLPAQIALPDLRPEVVPARPSRSDWIAAKVRELEGSEARARMHLA